MIEMKVNVIIPIAKDQDEHREDLGRCDSDRHGGRREER
jgi:hypothetical protein